MGLIIDSAQAVQTTRQTTTSTTNVDIPSVSIADSFFNTGDRYLIVATAQVDTSSASDEAGIVTVHGTTEFPTSDQFLEHASGSNPKKLDYFWFTVWIAVASEGIKMQFRQAGGTAGVDQVVLTAIKLNDFEEGTDWHFDENTTPTTLTTTFSTSNNASATFTPPNAGDDWLVLSTGRLTIDPALSNQIISRYSRSGEASFSGADISQEREIATESQIQTNMGVFNLGSASNTFTQESRIDETNGSDTRESSAILILNLRRFKNKSSSFDSVGITDLINTPPPANAFGQLIRSVSITPDNTGDVFALGSWIIDNGASGGVLGRLQVDNTDSPATQTSDAYERNDGLDGKDQHDIANQTIINLDTSAHTIDLDGSAESAGEDVLDSALVAFTLESIIETETFTIDGRVVSRVDKPFTVDAFLQDTFDENFTVDSILTLTVDETFTVDARLVVRNDETFTIDARVQATQLFNFTIDGLAQQEATKLFLIDAFIQATFDETFTIDARLAQREVFDIDARLAVRETFTIDGVPVADNTISIAGNMQNGNRVIQKASNGDLYTVSRNTVSDKINMHKSTNEGVSWNTNPLDFSNAPAINTNAIAEVIDSSNIIRITWWQSGVGLRSVTFSTSTDTFGTPETAVAEDQGTLNPSVAISIAGDGISHVAFIDGTINVSTFDTTYYTNRTGGTWKTPIQIDGATNSRDTESPDIINNPDNSDIPEIGYGDSTNADLRSARGNVKDATSFPDNVKIDDIEVGTRISMILDDDGDSHITYIKTITKDLTIAEHKLADAYSTWTPETIDTTIDSLNPTVVIFNFRRYVASTDLATGNIFLFREEEISWLKLQINQIPLTTDPSGIDIKGRWQSNNLIEPRKIKGVFQSANTTRFTGTIIVTDETLTLDARLAQRETFEVDAKVVRAVMINVDAVTQATFVSNFTVDVILVAINTKAFLVDAILKDTIDETFIIDAFIQALDQTFNFTIDGRAVSPTSKIFAIDGLTQGVNTKTFEIDARISIVVDKDFTVDSSLILRPTVDFTLDATLSPREIFTVGTKLKGTIDKDFLIDGLPFVPPATLYSIDALIQEQDNDKTFSVDAIPITSPSVGFTVDGLLQQLGITETFEVDARIKQINSEVFDIDSILKATIDKTFAVDTFSQQTESPKIFTIDSILVGTDFNFTVDSILKIIVDETFTIDARLRGRKDFTIDGLIFEIPSKLFNVDAIVLGIFDETFTVDSLIEELRTVTVQVDAHVRLVAEETFDIDSIIVDIVKLKVFDTDALLVIQNNKEFIVDSFVLDEIDKSFNIDSILAGAGQKPFLVDSLILKIQDKDFTVSSNIRFVNSETFNVDAIVKALNTNLNFTTDSLLKATQDGAFTIDAVLAREEKFTIDAFIQRLGDNCSSGIIFSDPIDNNTGWIVVNGLGVQIRVDGANFPNEIEYDQLGSFFPGRLNKLLNPSGTLTISSFENIKIDFKYNHISMLLGGSQGGMIMGLTDGLGRIMNGKRFGARHIRNGPQFLLRAQMSDLLSTVETAVINIPTGIDTFITVEKVGTDIRLNAYSDEARTIHIATSPTPFVSVSGLTEITFDQVGASGNDAVVELFVETGILDDIVVSSNVCTNFSVDAVIQGVVPGEFTIDSKLVFQKKFTIDAVIKALGDIRCAPGFVENVFDDNLLIVGNWSDEINNFTGEGWGDQEIFIDGESTSSEELIGSQQILNGFARIAMKPGGFTPFQANIFKTKYRRKLLSDDGGLGRIRGNNFRLEYKFELISGTRGIWIGLNKSGIHPQNDENTPSFHINADSLDAINLTLTDGINSVTTSNISTSGEVFVVAESLGNTVTLNVYSDPEHTTHVAGSPVNADSTIVDKEQLDMKFVFIGANPKFSGPANPTTFGEIDDIKIFSDPCPVAYVDAHIQLSSTILNFIIDAKVTAPISKIFTIDGLIKEIQTVDFIIDPITLGTQTLDITVDASPIRATQIRIDAKLVGEKRFTIDGIPFNPPAKLFTVKALLTKTSDKDFIIDSTVFEEKEAIFTVDAIILGLDTTVNFSISGKVVIAKQTQFTVDAIVKLLGVDGFCNFFPGTNFVVDTGLEQFTGPITPIHESNVDLLIGQEVFLNNQQIRKATFLLRASNFPNTITENSLITGKVWSNVIEGNFSGEIEELVSINIINAQQFSGDLLPGEWITITFDYGLNTPFLTGDFLVGFQHDVGSGVDDPEGVGVAIPVISNSNVITGSALFRRDVNSSFPDPDKWSFLVGDQKDMIIQLEVVNGNEIITGKGNRCPVMDSILVVRNTKTFTVDAILVNRIEGIFTIDVILPALTLETFNADALLALRKEFTIDAQLVILFTVNNKTFTIDGSAKFFNLLTPTSVNALIIVTPSKLVAVDGLLKEFNLVKLPRVDALLMDDDKEKTFIIDANIIGVKDQLFFVDGIMIIQDQEVTFQITASLAITQSPILFAVDAQILLDNHRWRVDGLIRTTNQRERKVDAILTDAIEKEFIVDGIIKSFNTEEQISVDALIKRKGIQFFLIDGLLSTENPFNFTIDGTIFEANRIINFVVDSIFVKRASLEVDAFIQSLDIIEVFTVDAIIGINEKEFIVDGSITGLDINKNFTIDAKVAFVKEIDFTVGAILIGSIDFTISAFAGEVIVTGFEGESVLRDGFGDTGLESTIGVGDT